MDDKILDYFEMILLQEPKRIVDKDGKIKEIYNQPERSKREDCKCPNRYLMNGTYMGKYCRCGALNTMET